MQKSPILCTTSDFLSCEVDGNHLTAKPAPATRQITDWITAASRVVSFLESPFTCVGHRRRLATSRKTDPAKIGSRSVDLSRLESGNGKHTLSVNLLTDNGKHEVSDDLLTEFLRPLAVAGIFVLQVTQQVSCTAQSAETISDLCARVAIAAGPLVPMPSLLDNNFEQRPQTCMCIAIWSIWLQLVLASVAGGSLVMHASSGGLHGLFSRFASDPTFHRWALLMPLPIVGGSMLQAFQFYLMTQDADGFGAAVVKLFGGEPAPPNLTRRVRALAAKAEMPEGTPKVYLIPSLEVNAFATGLTYDDAVVAVTQGILQIGMTDEELDAVLAHEIAHIRNQDIVSGAHLTVMIAGFSTLMSMGMRLWIYNLSKVQEAPPEGETAEQKQKRERDENAAKKLPMAMMIVGALTFIPGLLMQRWHSRHREFAADEAALALTGTDAMARALEKIDPPVPRTSRPDARPGALAARGPQFAHQYLTEAGAGEWIARVLSTHPPTQDRAAAVRKTLNEQ